MSSTVDFRAIPLRPDLLTHQFSILTPWIVITGAPCSGKTSVLQELGKLGYRWNPETARTYIETEEAKGRTVAKIRANEGQFQTILLTSKLNLEAKTPPDKLVFFDRAVPDSISYYRVGGLNPNDVLPYCYNFRYGNVFIFDRLPLQNDGARTEDDTTANFLDVWLERDYKTLGYKVTRVGLMSIEDRAQFVLSRLKYDGII